MHASTIESPKPTKPDDPPAEGGEDEHRTQQCGA
jgi:hypothetical protein